MPRAIWSVSRSTRFAHEVRRWIERRNVRQDVERAIDEAEVERVPASEDDSGEIERLPDGSVSIPLFEEELVVTKRLVVRERIVVRKREVVQKERVEATLGSEQVEIEKGGDR
jgi:uncharacterized protein (TIGR02271 family)